MKSFIENMMSRGQRLGLIHGRVNDLFLPADLQLRDVDEYLTALLKAQGIQHVIFYGSEGNRGAFATNDTDARFFFGQDAQSGEIIHSRRNWQLAEFVAAMLKRIKEPDASMAIVFYNILTTHLGESTALVDELLTGLQRSTANTLCLMMAPGTEFNCCTLQQTLAAYQLDSYFVTPGSADQRQMNPQTTFRIGAPEADEISRMLYRMQMGVGTPEGKRLMLGEPVNLVAEEIVFASRYKRSPDAYCTLREIMMHLNRYLDTETAPLTRDGVDRLLAIPVRNRGCALDKLNRPGWEAVYHAMKAVDRNLRKQIEDKRRMRSAAQPKAAPAASLVCARMGIADAEEEEVRIAVPNFLLMGNPGVGKTTVAQEIGQVLKEAGVLKLGHVHMTSQAALVSSLIGGVRTNTLSACDSAQEGILVLDDAQSLCNSQDGGVNHAGTAREIVATLVQAMTDPRRHFCVILCGYEEGVREALKLEDGLPRRFSYGGLKTEIVMMDYQPPVLEEILLGQIGQRGYRVDPALLVPDSKGVTPMNCFVERLYAERSRRGFGNADAMIKLANGACDSLPEGCDVVGVKELCGEDERRSPEWFKPRDTSCSLGAILREMEAKFVGMDSVKAFLDDYALQIEEMMADGMSLETLFTRAIALEGNAGTGKTTVANTLSRFYYGLGLSGTPDAIVHSAAELNSSAVGENDARILEWIRDARDKKGLLFIDEAHQLAAVGRRSSFNALMAPLSDRSACFQLVLAGYPKDMEALIASDQGGDRRFNRVIIEDYTPEELREILLRMLKAGGVTVTPDAEHCLLLLCRAIYETRSESTGNAGAMERLAEKLNIVRRRRVRAEKIAFGDPASKVITRADVEGVAYMQPPHVFTRLQEIIAGA